MSGHKPSESRSLKFISEYAQLMKRWTDERVGKTETEVAELNAAAERRAAAVRTRLWIHWLKVTSWTVSQAVFLVFGRDPNSPFIGHERYSDQESDFYKTARDRLAALADTKLLPTSRNAAAAKLRYQPGQLVLLASQEGWGFAKQLADLAERRGIVVSTSSAFSIPHRRAQLVYEFACELKGIDAKANQNDVTLKLTGEQFHQKLKQRYGSSHGELVYCSAKTLEAARLNRKNLPGIPKVGFVAGRPELDSATNHGRRRSR
jgi:hypothetical protein